MRFPKSSMLILAGLCVITIIAVLAMRRKPRMPAGPPPIEKGEEPSPGERQAPREIRRQEDVLWGQVVDAEGNAVPGATVEAGVFEGESPDSLSQKVFVRSTTTDLDGEFRFPDKEPLLRAKEFLRSRDELSDWLPKALHSLLVVSKDGYYTARQQVDLEWPGGPHKIVLRTSPEVSGHVVWKESREPFARINVVCRPEKADLYSPPQAECRTAQDGHFSLAMPAKGTARVAVQGWLLFTAFGLREARADITLVPGERISDLILAVELGSGTIIEGKVLNAEGGSVAGAEVRLSTDKRVSFESRSQEDGTYWLAVPKDWPYQSYFVEDWPDKPELSVIYHSPNLCVVPKEGGQPAASDSGWEWTPLWTPPPHAPPDRLVAFHPDYEVGAVEVPLLGVGQIRRGVDIVLHRGSRVSGKVVDDSSEPVEAANIQIKVAPERSPVLIEKDNNFIRWNRVSSGTDGGFEISFLPEGTYELTASHDDCEPTTKQLQLTPHQVVEGFDFVLVKRIGFIRGTVLDHSGNPWPRGRVKGSAGHYAGFGRTYEAEVKEDGSYELSHLKAGTYSLWLDMSQEHGRPGRILQATALRDIPTGTEAADIIVTELLAGSLRVRVVDDEHRPVERFFIRCCPLGLTYGSSGMAPEPMTDGSEVFIGTPGGEMSVRALSSRDSYTRDARYSGVLLCRREVVSESGEFVAERVAPGKYFVSVKTDDHPESFQDVEIVAGRETELMFDLEAFGRIEGIVVNKTGLPLEGIRVSAFKLREVPSVWDEPTLRNMALSGTMRRRAESDEQGQFSFEKLERGDYRVIAEANQGQSAFEEVTVGDDNRPYVRLVFDSGTGTIDGYVCGEDGGPLTGTMVTLEGNRQRVQTKTDEQGRYVFSDLVAGRYRIRGWIGRMGRWGTGPYRSQEIELAQGGRVSVDILAWGNGAIEGSISLAGDAARAAAWFEAAPYWDRRAREKRLVLRESTDSGVRGATEMGLSVRDGAFSFQNIPAGRYEVQAYFSIKINPEPIPILVMGDTRLLEASAGSEGRTALFASESVIVDVTSGSTASVNLAISQACFPHYPIPDPETCEKQSLFVAAGD